MNFAEQIKSNCGKLAYERITIWQLNKSELAKIPCGVAFVFARWSSHAVFSFQFLSNTLAKLASPQFTILVMDADNIDFDTFQDTFGELPQGKGEAYWIRNGQVLHRDHGYTDETKGVLHERIGEFT